MKTYLRKIIRKILGFDEIENKIKNLDDKYAERVATIHYFLNNYCDITEFPVEKNTALLSLQLCDVQLLRIVDKILRKYNITYWLDYGTLLGAVRHKGFIPWDDDMDISVVRYDFSRLKKEIPKELDKYGIDVSVSDARLGVSYKHLDTGIWLDVFPDDILLSNKSLEEVKSDLNYKQKEWRSKVLPIYENLREKEVVDMKNSIFGFPGNGSNKYYIQAPEMFGEYMRVHHQNTIFPIGKLSFAGYEFSVPHDVETFIVSLYGSGYMDFPKSGVLHHDLGRGPLSTWANRSGTNMQTVYDYLKKIPILYEKVPSYLQVNVEGE